MGSSTRLSNETPIHKGDLSRLEARRLRSAALFKQGIKQADVARALKVSRESVSRWYEAWAKGGAKSLRSPGRTGRPPFLKAAQLRQIERALVRGAVANGYPSELWTLRRVGEVIERLTGVSYHQGHVWRVLRGLGWSRQTPARRAVERDQEKIDAWKRDSWPPLKRGPKRGEPGSYSRTRAVSR